MYGKSWINFGSLIYVIRGIGYGRWRKGFLCLIVIMVEIKG